MIFRTNIDSSAFTLVVNLLFPGFMCRSALHSGAEIMLENEEFEFQEQLLPWKLVLGLFISKGTRRVESQVVAIQVYDSDNDDSCRPIARKGIGTKWVIPRPATASKRKIQHHDITRHR